MRLRLSVVLLGLLAGCSAMAKTSVDEDVVKGVVREVYDLEALFVNEHQYLYLPISPPTEAVLWQSFQKSVVPVDWKNFPTAFTKKVFAEMRAVDGNLYPLYSLFVHEDPVTRETVFSGPYGEVYRRPAEKNYDPFLWAKMTFQISDLSTLSERERW